jgi:hypothetical protein
MTLYLTPPSRLWTLLLLGLEVLLLPSEKKRNFNRLYGETQRRDFRPLEDKKYYSLFSRFIVGCFKSRIIKTWKQIRSKFTQPKKMQKSLSRLVCFFREQKCTNFCKKKCFFFNFYFDISKKIIVLSF